MPVDGGEELTDLGIDDCHVLEDLAKIVKN